MSRDVCERVSKQGQGPGGKEVGERRRSAARKGQGERQTP